MARELSIGSLRGRRLRWARQRPEHGACGGRRVLPLAILLAAVSSPASTAQTFEPEDGRIVEASALKELRRECASAPDKALPHERLARALLAGGLGEPARGEAERAVELEPRSAHAYATLGWVLQHDAIGRRLGPGFSREKALAAYARAKQLDPSLIAARGDYATLLEHDSRGRRYFSGADLAAAIAEYRSLSREFAEHGYDDNLLVDLLYAGRPDEVLELAATMTKSADPSAVVVAATALKGGPEAAVREAEKAVPDPSRRWQVLQTAAQSLVRLHAFAASAALLDAAGPISARPSELQASATLLRRARRLDEIPLPADQPSTVVRRLFIAIAREKPELDDPAALFGEGATGSKGSSQVPAAILQWARKKIESWRVPADLAAELELAAMKETVTGDDQLGFRIDLGTMTKEGEPEQVFVVRERGGYRVAAASSVFTTLGLEALRRVDGGDLRGARQWLDWARELVHEPVGDPTVVLAWPRDQRPAVPTAGHRTRPPRAVFWFRVTASAGTAPAPGGPHQLAGRVSFGWPRGRRSGAARFRGAPPAGGALRALAGLRLRVRAPCCPATARCSSVVWRSRSC
jgi:tetratricopeptide (TPR) repeat protein